MPEQRAPARGSRESECPFPGFIMAGFECSTFLWKDGQRKNYLALTGHDRFLDTDYAFLANLNIQTIREGVPWPFVDRGGGSYDFSFLDRAIEAAGQYGMAPIWDLCHFGFPDGCDPFSDSCVERFTAYCRAVAGRVQRGLPGPHFFTPVNEISFFADAGTEMKWCYPFAKGRHDEFEWALCRLAIEAVKAIRAVDPGARMVHVDPLVHTVAPRDRPDLSAAAYQDAYVDAFAAWDTLAGRRNPELGGSPEILDVVGVNTYFFSQTQLDADGSREVLAADDPRRRPLADLLEAAYRRYERPLLVGETSGTGEQRAAWARAVLTAVREAIQGGVDLRGVCFYPVVDTPDWNSGEWARLGLCDVEPQHGLARHPVVEYRAELRRWQPLFGSL